VRSSVWCRDSAESQTHPSMDGLHHHHQSRKSDSHLTTRRGLQLLVQFFPSNCPTTLGVPPLPADSAELLLLHFHALGCNTCIARLLPQADANPQSASATYDSSCMSEQAEVVAAAAFSTLPRSYLEHSHPLIASKLHPPPPAAEIISPFLSTLPFKPIKQSLPTPRHRYNASRS
jgi:hypothetical protein